MLKKTALSFIAMFAALQSFATEDIVIKVNGIKKQEGKILIAVFDNHQHFPNKTEKAVLKLAEKAEGNTCTFNLKGLKPGIYAIAVLHDLNDNKKMDYNFIGMPKEGYGFSNNPKVTVSTPGFKDSKIELRKGKNYIIELKY